MSRKLAAIYTRVSTDDQVHGGHSLSEQEDLARKFCEIREYDVYNIYEEPGVSGKNDARPMYQRLLKDMKQKKFSVIVALKLDRLSRDVIDSCTLFELTLQHNCKLDMVRENVDVTTPSGKMTSIIQSAVNQYQREDIVEKTEIGVLGAAKVGHMSGLPAFGYKKDVLNNDISKRKKLIIDDSVSHIVKEMFNLCSKGYTYSQIANIFKEKYPEIPLPKRKNDIHVRYRTWNDGTISTILNNKLYIGINEHRKRVKNKDKIPISETASYKYPAIISQELYDDCQKSIVKNSRNYYRKHKYLFVQKIACPNCGNIMSCSTSKKVYRYYRCKCQKPSIHFLEEQIESALVTDLNDILDFHTIFANNCLAFADDTDCDKELNNSLKQNLRNVLDNTIINDRLKLGSLNRRTNLWNSLDIDTKIELIKDYIDLIEVKKINEEKLEVTKIIFRRDKIEDFLFNFDKNIVTGYLQFNDGVALIERFKNEKQMNEHIEYLKDKYQVKTIELTKKQLDTTVVDTIGLVKIVYRYKVKAIEKDKYILVYI